MAIERMKLLSVVGKEDNITKFISQYLLESGMQPEDALKVYEKGWKLSYFNYDNRAKETLKQCEELMNELNITYSKSYAKVALEYEIDDIISILTPLTEKVKQENKTIKDCTEQISKLEEMKVSVDKLKNLDIDLGKLYNFRYLKFRYGKIKKNYYEKVKNEVQKMDVILFEIEEDENEVWIIYFTTKEFEAKVDGYFNVMKFERLWMSKEQYGIPKEMMRNIQSSVNENNNKIIQAQNEKEEIKKQYESTIMYLYRQLNILEKVNHIKRFFAHDNNNNFYLIGWMPVDELNQIMPKLLKEDIQVKVRSHDEVANTPPTHLKNNRIISKFESIVQMYGTPNYTETDPTLFVAITAFLMFGFMFGDVGQGLCIAIIGFIFNIKKKALGPVLIAGGVSAIVFGFLYGSFFGKEDILPSLIISPMKDITKMLIAGISFGALLIIIAMIINIKNGIKNKDIKRIFFCENGLAGILFYLSILSAVIYYFVNGKMIVSTGIFVSVLLIFLVVIMFKDKLELIIKKKKEIAKSSVVEKIFEIIEMLLSMASNTISFVRLSAFAINHVGLCMAVYILSNMTGGVGNIAITIIGNIIVIVLEGLIVAIQVLRLEYYELFSRFYQGDGKPYNPIKAQL